MGDNGGSDGLERIHTHVVEEKVHILGGGRDIREEECGRIAIGREVESLGSIGCAVSGGEYGQRFTEERAAVAAPDAELETLLVPVDQRECSHIKRQSVGGAGGCGYIVGPPGLSDGRRTEVLSGLREGQQVVVIGGEVVFDETTETKR